MDITKSLSKARQLLQDEKLSFVALDYIGRVSQSKKRGVAPPLELLGAQTDLTGGVIADKVVGKAAALLFLLLGPEAVYAATISVPAEKVLNSAGIRLEYEQKVGRIINREGTGPCPLEHAVLGIEDPYEALDIIHRTLTDLMSASNE
jgi:hypothetical protein